jgi:E3 ubiquitin-protein ligase HECTD1
MDFLYDHDFDENGVFYYLGTYGHKRAWQNPHVLGLIQCFTSSIGGGRVEDIAGRFVVNCRTLNEPFSFFGVDLGIGRLLAPSCYSLRNRNSTTHVLLNWHFEGSVDRVNWVLLDRRIYLSENEKYNQSVAAEQQNLCQKGATSTWGIDTSTYGENPNTANGFRYFRVVQVGKNSSGSDNLTLSGLEIYGRVSPQSVPAWQF